MTVLLLVDFIELDRRTCFLMYRATKTRPCSCIPEQTDRAVPGTSRPSESESVADSRAHWCALLCMRECLCVRVRVRVRACAFVRVRRVCGCRTRYVHASDSACVLAHAPGSAHSNSHTRERTLR
eukprot:5701843-Pleurochrysis_carterae.AAC.1